MVQAHLAALLARQDAADAGYRRDELAGPLAILGPSDIDVGELMVADGEGPAAERIEGLSERPGPDGQQARLAQDAIQIGSAGRRRSGHTR